MGVNSHGVSSLKKHTKPHKTAKRLAIKKAMLEARASKKRRK